MKKTINLSIGISAYNEETNIKNILTSLLAQKEVGFSLKEIIVVLDGSTDKTKERALAIKDKRIRLIVGAKRQGKASRLNQLFAEFTGDVLSIVDADVLISDNNLFAKLVAKSNFEKDGLVSVNVTPVSATTYFEQLIHTGVLVVKDVAKNWHNGENYLSFRGCLLTLDKHFAKQLHMPDRLVNDDTFFYFSALAAGYTPRYINDIFVYYKSPTNFNDHLNQSSRYRNSREEMERYFSLAFDKLYTIPFLPRLGASLKYSLLRPWYFFPYLGVLLLTKFTRDKHTTGVWKMALSTK